MAFNILNTITRYPYSIIAISVLCIEVAIALWVKQPFIRGFVGDVLVMILMYASIRAIIRKSISLLAEGLLVLAICIETLQYLDIVGYFQINSKLLKVILGSTFDWFDMLAYGIGYFCCKLMSKL